MVIYEYGLFENKAIFSIMFEIKSPKQLHAISSPLRQDLMDLIEAIGPAPVTTLAKYMEMPTDGLYYHLRMLKRAGLVVETTERVAVGRPQGKFDVAGRPVRIRYTGADTRTRKAIKRLIGSVMRNAYQGFRRAFSSDAVVEGPAREVWAGRKTGRLTDAEIEEMNKLIARMMELMDTSRRTNEPGGRLFSFTFAFVPQKRRGGRLRAPPAVDVESEVVLKRAKVQR
jgi:DNA-binding transcriptional ArsR family regulator